jgi:hypothetical protein
MTFDRLVTASDPNPSLSAGRNGEHSLTVVLPTRRADTGGVSVARA